MQYIVWFQDGDGSNVRKYVEEDLLRKGFDIALLDTPDARLQNQIGDSDSPLENEEFEKGLQYCMDTFVDRGDWRRKTYETYFQCPSLGLRSVCLACSRRCHVNRYLEPLFRIRSKGDTCDCNRSGHCVCVWSPIRGKFDVLAGDDGCIGPNQLRTLLSELRYPLQLDSVDFEECMAALAEGDENSDMPRISAQAFEEWFKGYFQKYE